MFKLVNRMKNRRGFTLIELVVVIAILGILALIAIPRFAGVREDAEVQAATTYATSVVNAAELYYVQTGDDVSGSSFTDMVDDLVDEGLLRRSEADFGDATFTLANNSPGSWQVTIGGFDGDDIVVGDDE